MYEEFTHAAKLLDEGHRITAQWNCGGDEALVDFSVDDERVSYGDPLFDELYEPLMITLELPSTGEYFVEGKGKFLLDDGQLFVEHESVANGLDWDVETGEETLIEDKQLGGRARMQTW